MNNSRDKLPLSSFHQKIMFSLSIIVFSFFLQLSLQSNVSALIVPSSSQVVSQVPGNSLQAVLTYKLCTRSTSNGQNYYRMCNTRTTNWAYPTGETQTIGGVTFNKMRFSFNSGHIDSSLYLLIDTITVSASDAFSDGSYTWLAVMNTDYGIYQGTVNQFYSADMQSWASDHRLGMGGLNSVVQGNSTYNISCLDQQPDCQFVYSWDTDTGIGSYFISSYKYIRPSEWSSNNINYYGMKIKNNFFNVSTGQFEWYPNTTDAYLYFINSDHSNGVDSNNSTSFNVDFWMAYVETNTLVSTASDDALNPDSALGAWEAEKNYIENSSAGANSDNNSLLGISINSIALPFSNWFALFTDQSCVDVSAIPGWFGLGSQHICSPWPSSIKSVLTPLMSAMSIMLLFGFVIGFLRGGSTPGDDISYGGGKYKGVH